MSQLRGQPPAQLSCTKETFCTDAMSRDSQTERTFSGSVIGREACVTWESEVGNTKRKNRGDSSDVKSARLRHQVLPAIRPVDAFGIWILPIRGD